MWFRRFSAKCGACGLLLALTSGCQAPEPIRPLRPSNPTLARQIRRLVDPQICAIRGLDIHLVGAERFKDLPDIALARMEQALLATGRFTTAERNRLRHLQSEVALSSDSVWFNQETVVSPGGFVGARFVMLPSFMIEVGAFTTTTELTLKVVDLELAKTEMIISGRGKSRSLATNASVHASLERALKDLETAIVKALPPRAEVISVGPGFNRLTAVASMPSRFKLGQKVRLLTVSNGDQESFSSGHEIGTGTVKSCRGEAIEVRLRRRIEPIEGLFLELIPCGD